MHSEPLVGTWSLESANAKGSKGDEGLLYGEAPQGLLIYTPGGHMAVVLMAIGRPKFSTGSPRSGTPAELKQGFEQFDAYAGTYTHVPEHGVVTHHVSASRFPNWEGTDQIRFVSINEDQLTLTTPPITGVDQEWVLRLTWRRVSAR